MMRVPLHGREIGISSTRVVSVLPPGLARGKAGESPEASSARPRKRWHFGGGCEVAAFSIPEVSALPPGLGGGRAGESPEASSSRPRKRWHFGVDASLPRGAGVASSTQQGREGGEVESVRGHGEEIAGRRRAVVVVDLGVGNLGNVARALRWVGGAPEVTAAAARVAAAKCLVLPGVGAFRPPREALRGELESALRAAVDGGAWLLGICVGYQLLFEESHEYGRTDGLGLLPGRVEPLPAGVPLPHIGWNRLWDMPTSGLFAGLAPGEYAYFVHSFAPAGVPPDSWLAATTHGTRFAAAAGRGRVLGTQFHPERSGEAGLRVLGNFLEMAHGPVAGD